jgi:uncharacterized protein
LDDALVHRQPGVPWDQHVWALLAVTVAGVGSAWAFPRLRPGLQSGLAVTAALVTGVNGAMHLLHVLTGEVGGSDVTGLLALAAAAVLLALGVAIPYLRRGEGRRSRRRRWANRGIAAVTAVVVGQFVVVPVGVGLVQTHLYRKPIGAPPSADYRDVSFESTDGLLLSGWYAPSRNRAAVVLVNTSGGHRTGSLGQARLLAAHGYGVLLYDARGAGRSEGTPNGWGWNWDRDVLGALEFLRRQPDVDPARIGGLGLSTGADVLIEVAAEHDGLAAVVADGATARSFADDPRGGVDAPILWAMTTAGRLFSGTSPGRPLVELMAEVSPTPLLLVASGLFPGERELNLRYAAAGGPTVALWDVRDGNHTAAIREFPQEYGKRVVGLFDRTLLR